MRRSYFTIVLFFGFTAITYQQVCHAQEGVQSTNDTVECPRFIPALTQPQHAFVIQTFDPIGNTDLDRYAQFLELSEAQKVALGHLHGKYCTQCTQLKSSHLDAIFERLMAWARTDQFSAKDYEQLRADHAKFLKAVNLIEQNLFEALSASLAEKQLEALPVVRADRERTIYGSSVFPSSIHGEARIDLVDLLEIVGIEEFSNDVLRGVMTEYRQAVAPLLRQIAEQRASASVKMRYLQEQMSAIEEPEHRMKAGMVIEEQLRGIRRPSIMNDRKLKAINSKHFHRVMELLDEADQARLSLEFYRRAYPNIYSNYFPIDIVAKPIVTLDSLTDEQRAAITTVIEGFRPREETARRKLEDFVDQYMERRMGGEALFVEEIEQYNVSVKAELSKMHQAQQDVIVRLRSMLTPHQLEALPKVRQAESGEVPGRRAAERKGADNGRENPSQSP